MKKLKILGRSGLVFLICLVIICALLLFSCGSKKKTVNCEELLIRGIEYCISGYRDNGYLFLKGSSKEDSFYMPESLKRTLYGERHLKALEECKDYAVYLSASTPYELAVFECYSRDGAEEILQMCYERADTLKVGLRFTEWERASKGIYVFLSKRRVFFLFCESFELSESAVEELLLLTR